MRPIPHQRRQTHSEDYSQASNTRTGCRQAICRVCRQDMCCVSRQDICCVSRQDICGLPRHPLGIGYTGAAATVWAMKRGCLGRPQMSCLLTQQMSCLLPQQMSCLQTQKMSCLLTQQKSRLQTQQMSCRQTHHLPLAFADLQPPPQPGFGNPEMESCHHSDISRDPPEFCCRSGTVSVRQTHPWWSQAVGT